MGNILKIEKLAMFLLAIYLFSLLSFDWWWYLVLFLAPDVSFLAYLVNNKTGALVYNICHHKAIGIALYGFGIYLQNEMFQLVGLVLFGHSSFDRMLGYDLKYMDSFNNTHLGVIGKK